MERSLKLTFSTDQNKKAIMTVPFAKEAPTLDELKTAMDQIIATQIVNVKAGELLSKENAELVTKTTTEVTML